MSWEGNLVFKELVERNKKRYHFSDKKVKVKVAENIINEIKALSLPRRFLKISSSEWIEIGMDVALKKTRQALRDNAKIFINQRNSIKELQWCEAITTLDQNLSSTNSSVTNEVKGALFILKCLKCY